jgi:hypothetical protein
MPFTMFDNEPMSNVAFIDYVTNLVTIRDWLRMLRRADTADYAATQRMWDEARAEVITRGLTEEFEGIDAVVFTGEPIRPRVSLRKAVR